MIGRLIAAAALLVALAASAQAQNYPNRIIKIMLGFPPGGNVDIIARMLAHEMEKSLGQSIVVENRVGAGRRGRCRGDRARRAGRLHAADGAEFASGLRRTGQERQIQRGGRFHLDFGGELLSVHDLREGGFAFPRASRN